MIKCQRETMLIGLDEVLALAVAHCRELRPDRTFDPDVERLRDLFCDGGFRVYSARLDGVMIGYAAFTVAKHLLFKSETFAVECGFFIDRAHRGRHILLLLRFAEADLFVAGVNSIMLSEQVEHPVSVLFRRLGYRPIESAWIKDQAQQKIRRAA